MQIIGGCFLGHDAGGMWTQIWNFRSRLYTANDMVELLLRLERASNPTTKTKQSLTNFDSYESEVEYR